MPASVPSACSPTRAAATVKVNAVTVTSGTASAPQFWPCWMDLGSVQLRLGKKREALASYRQVLSGSRDPALRTKAAEYVNLLESQLR